MTTQSTLKEWNLDPETICSTLAESDKVLNQIIKAAEVTK